MTNTTDVSDMKMTRFRQGVNELHGLCPSGERSRSSRRGKYADIPITSSSFQMATDVRGLYNASSIMPTNPLTSNGNFSSQANRPSNRPDFAASPGRLGWPAHSRPTLACTHRFSHILR